MLTGYLRLLIFMGLFLVILQLPSAFDQYRQHIATELAKKNQQLIPYQEAANKLFNGNLKQLIEAYRTNQDQAFRDQSDNAAKLYHQSRQLQGQIDTLQAPWQEQLKQWQRHFKQPLVKESLQRINFQSTLPQTTILRVLAVVFILMLILEVVLRALFMVLSYVFYIPKQREKKRL